MIHDKNILTKMLKYSAIFKYSTKDPEYRYENIWTSTWSTMETLSHASTEVKEVLVSFRQI